MQHTDNEFYSIFQEAIPDECASIASFQKFWKFFVEVLKEVGK
jgi:hypothetical protein